jgi:hypothetical protein
MTTDLNPTQWRDEYERAEAALRLAKTTINSLTLTLMNQVRRDDQDIRREVCDSASRAYDSILDALMPPPPTADPAPDPNHCADCGKELTDGEKNRQRLDWPRCDKCRGRKSD